MGTVKHTVLFPQELAEAGYTGDLFGYYQEESDIYNVTGTDAAAKGSVRLGGIGAKKRRGDRLSGCYVDGTPHFEADGEACTVKAYSLIQNIFSRNTGILESDIMLKKCAVILGCGSVGSLVALELARSGVGRFLLVDTDTLEYHNLCRHQCDIPDVGRYKALALKDRIQRINPRAQVEACVQTVEELPKEVFDRHCTAGNAILIGCADNRAADVYGNRIAVLYRVPFLSVGFWERAFAGELFYWLPEEEMPCYRCALGDGGGLSQRVNANHHIYTNQEDLENVNFEPGISADIDFVTVIGVKLALDILNRGNDAYTPRLLGHLKQYTLVCNTNDPKLGGEMAEIFAYPLQVTTSLVVGFGKDCPPCKLV